jgi:ferrous iron transport protein B
MLKLKLKPVSHSTSRPDCVVLIGKESVGKSALISSLTGRLAQANNFRGTTISCDTYKYGRYEFIDTPGILRKSDTETTQAALAKLNGSETVLLVAQATHFDEDLDDLLPLVQGRRCVIVATFSDKLSRQPGVTTQIFSSLREELQLEIISVDARRLVLAQRDSILHAIDTAARLQLERTRTRVGWVVAPRQSWLEHKIGGPLLATLLILLPSVLAVWAANTFAGVVAPLIGSALSPIITFLSHQPPFLREILIGDYGLFTMGPLLFVWAVPTVVLYAILLATYKTSGLLDRMSMALHPLVRHAGMSGRDLVRVLMGFGCNVPAVISTRACSSCSRSTVISTIAFGSACSYQFGATLAVFAAAKKPFLVLPFLGYLGLTTIIYARLTSSSQGRSSLNVLLLEGRTFLVFPSFGAVWREAFNTIRGFFKLALPIFFVITLIASIMTWTGILNSLAVFIRPLMAVFRLPAEAALPAIMACIRKDGILLFAKYDQLANLTNIQLLTAVYFAGELLPCLVTILTIARERSSRFVMSLVFRQAVAATLFSLALAWSGLMLSL